MIPKGLRKKITSIYYRDGYNHAIRFNGGVWNANRACGILWLFGDSDYSFSILRLSLFNFVNAITFGSENTQVFQWRQRLSEKAVKNEIRHAVIRDIHALIAYVSTFQSYPQLKHSIPTNLQTRKKSPKKTKLKDKAKINSCRICPKFYVVLRLPEVSSTVP